jgi:hypothetical protein
MADRKTPGGGDVFFSRYRRLPDGTILDAQDYGHKAWPFRGMRRTPKKPKPQPPTR